MERVNNVAETIGKLIINGYGISQGVMESVGKFNRYTEITLKRRYAYFDNEDNLQGFDEYITINVNTGDYTTIRKPVEKYKRYSSN